MSDTCGHKECDGNDRKNKAHSIENRNITTRLDFFGIRTVIRALNDLSVHALSFEMVVCLDFTACRNLERKRDGRSKNRKTEKSALFHTEPLSPTP